MCVINMNLGRQSFGGATLHQLIYPCAHTLLPTQTIDCLSLVLAPFASVAKPKGKITETLLLFQQLLATLLQPMHKVSDLSKITALSSKIATIIAHPTISVPLHSKYISSSTSPSPLPVPSQEHIAHLILDQKSASQALQTFKWASKLPSFTHSHSTYRALIHKLCTFRRFDTVYKLLEEMPHSIGSDPSDGIFITIIRGLGRARMIPDVIKITGVVSRFQKTPSLKVFNSILDVLVKHDIVLAREFYRKRMMRNGVHGDDYTFGILMKGLCVTNRIADAFKLLQLLKSSNVKPNTVIYNTLLHALCKNGKIGRARSLMNEIENPNDVTFNVLISRYCKENNLVQALVMLEKSFSFGFVADVITVTKVVEILCNVGRVTEAAELLERVESMGGVIDVVAYNTLIKGCCKLGKVKVGYGFVKEMERKGCLPNIDTYNVLISGFCESEMFDAALDVFNEMKSDAINWNFVTYDTLIRGLFSGSRIEQGYKILELMEESKGGSQGCISPYNSVLYGLYKKNMWEEALEFLMKMDKLFPRAVGRSLRTLSLCEAGAMEDAKAVYNQMINEGGLPSALVYDCLIHGFCRKGCVREAFELMNKMAGHGYVPVTSTFNALISEFCRQEKDGSALKLLEDLVGRGCMPNTASYSPLIDFLCRRGNFQKALSLFLQMAEKGITPDHTTWNSLLAHHSQQTIWTNSKNLIHINNMVEWIIKT